MTKIQIENSASDAAQEYVKDMSGDIEVTRQEILDFAKSDFMAGFKKGIEWFKNNS